MDGVLYNFVSSAVKALNHDYKRSITPMEINHWDIAKIYGITTKQFWESIDARGKYFWQLLSRYPWFDRLIDAVAMHSETNFYLCSSPSLNPDSYIGKRLAVTRDFGKYFDRLILTNHKEMLAKSDVVLIDDSEKNVSKFIAAGGKAILFPQYWNANVEILTEALNPIEYVEQELIKIKSSIIP